MSLAESILSIFEREKRELTIDQVRTALEVDCPGGYSTSDVGTAMADLVAGGNESSGYSARLRKLERVARGVYRLAEE